jgi:hypothetical protein
MLMSTVVEARIAARARPSTAFLVTLVIPLRDGKFNLLENYNMHALEACNM